jgi:hypothetical protein
VLGVLVLALLASWVYARLEGRNRSAPAPASDRPVRVQVLNGCGEGGIAARVASFLREGGFQVVEVRNADRGDYFATLVVAREEDPAAATAVARYLGGPPVVRQAWDQDLADVTVVIGSDRSRLRLDPER